MKSILIFAGSMVSSILLARVVSFVFHVATGNYELAATIGVATWLFSFLTILPYASLWFTDSYEIANPPEPTSTVQKWRSQKEESKLRAAELRMGFVFGLIGGVSASMAEASSAGVSITVVLSALVGGIIGFDLKRRVFRIRERYASS